MDIRDLGKKYNLDGKVDVWKCHNNWILTHDAITKIAHIENIKLVNIESIYQSETSCRFLITMTKYDDGGEPMESITSVGEADKSNCTSKYYGCMAEKRGYDRCVLKLIDAYAHGFVSEEESDDWKHPESESAAMATAYQGKKLVEVLKHLDGYDKEKAKYVYKHLTKKEADLMIQLMESGKVEKFQDLFYEAYDLLIKTENLWKSIKGEVE